MVKLVVGVVAMGINIFPNHQILKALEANITEMAVNSSSTVNEELVNFIINSNLKKNCLLIVGFF